MVVGRRSFPIGKVTFQGLYYKFQEGILNTTSKLGDSHVFFCGLEALALGSYHDCSKDPWMVRTTFGESTWPCAGWEGEIPAIFGAYFTHMFVGIRYQKNRGFFPCFFLGRGSKLKSSPFCCLTWVLLGFWSNGCWFSNILGPKHRELYKWSFSNSNSCCCFFQTDVCW